MSKRKFYVESITEYVGAYLDKVTDTRHEIWYKVNGDMHRAETDIKSVKNSGGEAWDWAQKNWPEFIPEDGEPIVIGDITVPMKLRWACIQGIYSDAKKKKMLPIEEVTTSYKHYGKAKKKNDRQGEKRVVNKRTKKKSTKKKAPPRSGGGVKAKKQDKQGIPSGVEAVVDIGVDIDKLKAEKIAEAMKEE